MDAALVNPFIEGTLHILDTTAFVKVAPKSPYLKKNRKSLGDITGLLEISGDLAGSAAITFSKESILGVVSAMFGEEMTEINEEIHDAVGEISNMLIDTKGVPDDSFKSLRDLMYEIDQKRLKDYDCHWSYRRHWQWQEHRVPNVSRFGCARDRCG